MTCVYPVYGRRLASCVELPEIQPCDGPAEWHFAVGPLGRGEFSWFDIWPTERASPWVRAFRTADGYRIRYERRCEFLIDCASHTITCEPDDCPDAMMRHFLLDQVLPLTFSLDGIVLHASSVAIGGGFAAFIGPGGAGKSTIALALGRAGYPIGSDDGLLVEERSGRAMPSYPSVRVWPDSAATVAGRRPMNPAAPATTKHRYRDGFTYATDPLPLKRLYVLDPEPASSVRFDSMPPRAAMMALVEQSYRLALDDRSTLARQ
ncbi:MAG TPA: hypothetical protein VFZ98_05425, partial [Vicinamibacterales bacterium]